MTASCYITFPTTFFAIRAESILKEKGSRFKMVPVPRSISSSCGTALNCACNDLSAIRELLLNDGLEIEGLYTIEESGLKKPVAKELSLDDLESM